MKFESEFYTMEWDAGKNRAYVAMRGFWQSEEGEPNFLKHWRMILAQTKPGFTTLIDAVEFLTPPQQILDLIAVAQKESIEAGVSKRAEIVPESFIGSMATRFAAQQSGIEHKTQKFSSKEAADKWLDEALRDE